MPSGPIYRIDKFIVPAKSMARFMTQVRATHLILDGAEGCLQNLVLEQVSGPGEFNVVTFVEWSNVDAFEVAKTVLQTHHAASGFVPKQFMKELDVRADIANYTVG